MDDTSISALELQSELILKWGCDLNHRAISLYGEISETSLKELDKKLSLLEAIDLTPIKIRINSVGGDVYAGLSMAARIRKSPCSIHGEASGAIMSMAVLIFASMHFRTAHIGTNFMMHEFSYNTLHDKTHIHKSGVEQVEKEQQMYCKLLSDYTGTDNKIFEKIMAKKVDQYFDADQALKLGLITEIFT
jgi:ATP-dependent protease ClpP protease subunit